MQIIPDLIELGLTVLNPVQPVMPLEKLKREFGNDLVFFEGIDVQRLPPLGTPEQVRNGVKKCIKILGKGKKGYVIAPSQTLMTDIPNENFEVLIESIKEFR